MQSSSVLRDAAQCLMALNLQVCSQVTKQANVVSCDASKNNSIVSSCVAYQPFWTVLATDESNLVSSQMMALLLTFFNSFLGLFLPLAS